MSKTTSPSIEIFKVKSKIVINEYKKNILILIQLTLYIYSDHGDR